MTRSRVFFGWWVVAASAVISFWAGGIFYGTTAFFRPLVEEFGWSYLSVSLAGSLRSVEIGLLAPVLGLLADRFGPRPVVLLSGIGCGLGFLLLSRVQDLFLFYTAFILLCIGLSGLATAVTTNAVANWFKRNVGRAMGLTVVGYGAGGLLIPLIVWLIQTWGWRAALVWLAFLTWAVVTPAALFLRHQPEAYGWFPDGDAAPDLFPDRADPRDKSEVRLGPVLRSREFWYLSAAFSSQFMVVSAVSLHVMPYLRNLGLAENPAALVAMFIPLASIPGRILFGLAADRADTRRVVALCFLLQAAGMALFTFGRTLGHMVLFLAFFGPGFGGIQVLRGVIVREHFGRSRYGTVHGLVLAVMTLGGFTGPALAGWVFDLTGSYRPSWMALTLASLASAPLILLLERVSRR